MMTSPDSVPSFVSRQVSESRRFYLDLNPPSSSRVAVVCGGWEGVRRDYRIERDDFPYYGLEYVVQGAGAVVVGRNQETLRRGIAFCYGPGKPHRITTDPDRLLSKYYVDFTGREMPQRLRDCQMEPGSIVEVGDPGRIEMAFERLLEAGLNPGPNQVRITTFHLEILLLEISGIRMDSPGQTQAYQTFLRCRAYIDQHFLEHGTADEIAGACHVTSAYLSRLFTQHAGETPYRYLLQRKMNHGADLLDGGGLLVREVADLLEMDPFQFSKVFKRTFGITPSDFAKRRASVSSARGGQGEAAVTG